MSSLETMQHLNSSVLRIKVILAGLCALVLSVGLARFAYTPMLPIMHDQAGLTVVNGGWLATWNYAGYMCGALIAASISRLEVKFLLYRAGLLIAIISNLTMGLTQSLMLWGLLRFFSGMSSVAGLLLASGLVLNWLMRHGYKPELGLHFMGMGIGIVISGIAVEFMSSHLDWSEDWFGLGFLGGVFFVIAWFWMPAPSISDSKLTNSENKLPSKFWMALLILSYLCAGYGYVVSATFIVDIIDRIPAFSGKGNWVWILVGLAAIPTSFIWDRVARRCGTIQALIIAYLLQIVSILLPVFSSSVSCILLSAVLFGGTFVGVVSLTLVLIGRYYPGNPAKAMARLTLSYGAAQVIGPVITGYLTSHFGNYNAALMFVAAVMLIGVLVLVLLARTPVFISNDVLVSAPAS
jgi:predicted MFS family arabinose efflux permease